MKRLTVYELSLGCVQTKTIGANRVELYREHTTYHVRRFASSVCGRRVQECWLCFDTIDDARRCYARQLDIAKAVNN